MDTFAFPPPASTTSVCAPILSTNRTSIFVLVQITIFRISLEIGMGDSDSVNPENQYVFSFIIFG